MNQDDKAIIVTQLSKQFKLPHERSRSLKSATISFVRRKHGYELQKALKNVSFTINKGEFFGIVGRNGSGKSTLLKVLAGIYSPNKGDVKINGSLTPFIELGVGFNAELSGRDNVYLNGALLGFNRKQMDGMYDEIVEFAELRRFMDQKLKNYSSGMQVRLAFSIAIRARSDILLLDEVLAVGDVAFQKKCLDHFEKLKHQKRTVVLVTHDMLSVRNLCTRAAVLSNGKLEYIGDADKAADLYETQNAGNTKLFEDRSTGSGKLIIEELNDVGKKTAYHSDDKIKLHIKLRAKKKVKANVVIQIAKDNGSFIAGQTSEYQIPARIFAPGKLVTYEFVFSADQFANGNYKVDGFIFEKGIPRPVFFKEEMAEFTISNDSAGWGALNLQGKWRIIK